MAEIDSLIILAGERKREGGASRDGPVTWLARAAVMLSKKEPGFSSPASAKGDGRMFEMDLRPEALLVQYGSNGRLGGNGMAEARQPLAATWKTTQSAVTQGRHGECETAMRELPEVLRVDSHLLLEEVVSLIPILAYHGVKSFGRWQSWRPRL